MLYLYNPQENLSSEVPDDMLYPVPTKLATSTCFGGQLPNPHAFEA